MGLGNAILHIVATLLKRFENLLSHRNLIHSNNPAQVRFPRSFARVVVVFSSSRKRQCPKNEPLYQVALWKRCSPAQTVQEQKEWSRRLPWWRCSWKKNHVGHTDHTSGVYFSNHSRKTGTLHRDRQTLRHICTERWWPAQRLCKRAIESQMVVGWHRADHWRDFPQKTFVGNLTSPVCEPIREFENDVDRFQSQKCFRDEVYAVCKTPNRVDGWKGHIAASTVLFNERFEVCGNSVVLSHHVRRSVSRHRNELVKTSASFFQLFEKKPSHFFPRRNSAGAYEDGDFQGSVVKRKPADAGDQVLVSKERRVSSKREEKTLLHILSTQHKSSLLVFERLPLTRGVTRKKPPCNFFFFWLDERDRSLQKWKKVFVLVPSQRQPRWQLSKHQRNDPRLHPVSFLVIDIDKKSVQYCFSIFKLFLRIQTRKTWPSTQYTFFETVPFLFKQRVLLKDVWLTKRDLRRGFSHARLLCHVSRFKLRICFGHEALFRSIEVFIILRGRVLWEVRLFCTPLLPNVFSVWQYLLFVEVYFFGTKESCKIDLLFLCKVFWAFQGAVVREFFAVKTKPFSLLHFAAHWNKPNMKWNRFFELCECRFARRGWWQRQGKPCKKNEKKKR